MRLSEAKELFRSLLQEYFSGAIVKFANQSRVAKSGLPLVVIKSGNVRRDRDAVISIVDGVTIASYLSRVGMTVDLFTKGLPVVDPDTGKAFASENTAMEDVLSLIDFLSSQHVTDWCSKHDVSIGIDGDAQDLTDIVNDNNYDYRARVSVLFYFTQNAIGYAGVLGEGSIKVPEGTDKNDWKDATIDPEFKPSSTGGGSEELASKETGYFTEVEIKEEKANE